MVRANGQRDGVGKTRDWASAFEHSRPILDSTRVSPYGPAAREMPQSMRPDTRQHLTACTGLSEEQNEEAQKRLAFGEASTHAQSRNDERKPCVTAAIRCCWSILGSVDAEIGFPLRMGNTSRLPSPSVRAASRISTARRHNGTRCSRFAFILAAEIVHTRPAVSISSQVASRTSTCQIGVRISSTSAVLTSETGRRPMRGKHGVRGSATKPARATGRASRRASVRAHAERRRRRWEHLGRGACRPASKTP